MTTFNFTTGPTTLPDVGQCAYNGCMFGPLFVSNVSGNVVQDNANRTTKLMEYTLTLDGYVTLAAGATSVSPAMTNLQNLLTMQAGSLTYKGRGFDLVVNAAGMASFGGTARDVAWGPIPHLLEFQPLGGGLSAKVKWVCVLRVVAYPNPGIKSGGGLLQFNCETVVSYGEDGYSSLSVTGTMEIPLTRATQGSRTLAATIDDQRFQLDSRIFSGIDLERFRVVSRNYPVSRDKRTMDFDVQVEEKSYMDLPPGCTIARGRYSVKPVKQGAGLVNWVCSLNATYTVRADAPRRVAWFAFLALMRLRMNQSVLGNEPTLIAAQKFPGGKAAQSVNKALNSSPTVPPKSSLQTIWNKTLAQQAGPRPPQVTMILHLTFDEGLYLDSKTMSISAAWTILSSFDGILLASGLWRKLPEIDNQNGNLWAANIQGVSGSVSWLPNKLDPSKDIIVDFGGG